MKLRFNGVPATYTLGSPLFPLKSDIPVLIAIDPGKTNMALGIMNIRKDILQKIEISGSGMDTSLFCQEVVSFLKIYLCDVEIARFGIEQAILKKGMEYYSSQMVLTQIRATLIDAAIYLTKSPPKEINNFSWKAGVLPKGYRGHNEKGSHRYLVEQGVVSPGESHDITDVICMLLYMYDEYQRTATIRCLSSEEPIAGYTCLIIPRAFIPKKDITYFTYNKSFSVKDNATYFVNRCKTLGVSLIDIQDLSLEDIYTFTLNGSVTDEACIIVEQGG